LPEAAEKPLFPQMGGGGVGKKPGEKERKGKADKRYERKRKKAELPCSKNSEKKG